MTVTVVTGGAGGGIGSAICRHLAASGHLVWVADREEDAAVQVASEIVAAGGQAVPLAMDVADEESVQRAFAEVGRAAGRVDGLVCSAGVGLVRAAAEVTAQDFDRLMSVDLRGVWLCVREALPAMRSRGGSIVLVGSNHAKATAPGYAIYAAAKAALVGLARGVAIDYGAVGVRCNVVHPGLVDGPSNRQVLAGFVDDVESWMAQWVDERQCVPRPIEPDDIAAVVAFLLAEQSRAITGTELTADLGTSALLFDRNRPGGNP